MAFIPIPETAMVEVRQSLDGQQIENTLYFRMTGGFEPADLLALGNAVLSWFTANVLPSLSVNLTLREVYVTDMRFADGQVVTIPAPTPTPAGGNEFQALPNNCALCVSFRTVYRGRSYRGRNYVAGLPETSVNLSTVTPGFANAIEAAYGELIGAGAIAPAWEFAVVSRYANGAPRAAGVATPVTAVLVVDPTVDSQRRRLPGRGS